MENSFLWFVSFFWRCAYVLRKFVIRARTQAHAFACSPFSLSMSLLRSHPFIGCIFTRKQSINIQFDHNVIVIEFLYVSFYLAAIAVCCGRCALNIIMLCNFNAMCKKIVSSNILLIKLAILSVCLSLSLTQLQSLTLFSFFEMTQSHISWVKTMNREKNK